jgi:hypothetical protein
MHPTIWIALIAIACAAIFTYVKSRCSQATAESRRQRALVLKSLTDAYAVLESVPDASIYASDAEVAGWGENGDIPHRRRSEPRISKPNVCCICDDPAVVRFVGSAMLDLDMRQRWYCEPCGSSTIRQDAMLSGRMGQAAQNEVVRGLNRLATEATQISTHDPISRDHCPGPDDDDCSEQCRDFGKCGCHK